jgi:tetratricopeptide (TPR) repeat protein
MTPRASDSRKRSCAYHPGIVADTACERCGRLFCAECVKSWNGKDLGPLCRRERVRRRVVIGFVLAVMLAAPAAVIVWGYDQHRRYGSARHRVRARQKMLQRFPHSAGIRLRLAQDLLGASRPNQAKTELDRLLKDHPNHLGGLLTRSRLATAQRDHSGALRYAIRALLSTPRSWAARLAVARAHLALERPDKAETTLRAGLKRDPRALNLTLELVSILKKQKRTTEAVGLLRQAQHHARSRAARKSLQRRIDQLTQPNK